MPPGNEIIATTKEDIKRTEQLLVGSSVRRKRIALRRIENRIIILTKSLDELYTNESIVNAGMLNNLDMIYINKRCITGLNTQSSPVQALDKRQTLVDMDPHQKLAYEESVLSATEEGVPLLKAEINKMNSEIKQTMIMLNFYKESKEKIDEEIRIAEEKEEKNLKFVRKLTSSPTRTDFEEDQIARSRTAYILLLQKISENWNNLTSRTVTSGTVKVERGYPGTVTSGTVKVERGYPDEDKLARQLNVLQKTFYSTAQVPGLVYINAKGELSDLRDELDFDDPGSDKNIGLLEKAVVTERYTAKNKKMSMEVDRYIKNVLDVANDPLTSRGIIRRPDPTLPASDSIREQTKSYPGAVLKLGPFYFGAFEMKSFLQCWKKRWKKRCGKLYYGLPPCPAAEVEKKKYETSADEKEKTIEEETTLLKDKGMVAYENKLKEARTYQEEETKRQLGDLPDDAPDWVVTYVEKYGESSSGVLSYIGKQVKIFRGTGDTTQKAIEDANKLIPYPPEGTVQLDSYTYTRVIIEKSISIAYTIWGKESQ